jgi:hypothetical protein
MYIMFLLNGKSKKNIIGPLGEPAANRRRGRIPHNIVLSAFLLADHNPYFVFRYWVIKQISVLQPNKVTSTYHCDTSQVLDGECLPPGAQNLVRTTKHALEGRPPSRMVRASPAARRISDVQTDASCPFASDQMVEIVRTSVCVGSGSSGTTHNFFSFMKP